MSLQPYYTPYSLLIPTNFKEYLTYVDSEIFEAFKLAQALLQLGFNLQVLGFGVFKEGPELLKSIQLPCGQKTNVVKHDCTEDKSLFI